MTVSPIAVCFTFDENYARPAWVAVNSLLSSRKTLRSYDIYLITDGELSDEWKAKFQSLRDDRTTIRVHSTDEFQIKLPKVQIRHLNSSTTIRLFMDQFIDAPRVLYLDVDLLVCEDVEPLFRMDLKGKTVGVVRDPWATEVEHNVFSVIRGERKAPANWEHQKKVYGYLLTASLGQPLFDYFNTGVMLVDLQRFSELGIGKTALQRLSDHHCFAADQCALNYAMREDWAPLASSWNTFRCNEQVCGADLPAEQHAYFAEGLKRQSIIHYPGEIKPWLGETQNLRGPRSWRSHMIYAEHPAAREVFSTSELALGQMR